MADPTAEQITLICDLCEKIILDGQSIIDVGEVNHPIPVHKKCLDRETRALTNNLLDFLEEK